MAELGIGGESVVGGVPLTADETAQLEEDLEVAIYGVNKPKGASVVIGAADAALQARMEEMSKELNEVRAERDELARRSVPEARSSDSGAAAVAEMEKTLLAIRQARDTVLSKNRELTDKLAFTEDQLADVSYEREVAEREKNEMKARVEELEAAPPSGEGDGRAVEAVLEQLAQMQGDMKAAWDRVAELETEVGVLREAPNAGEAMVEEVEALRKKLASMEARAERSKGQQRKSMAALVDQLAAAHRSRDLAVSSVAKAQRQIEDLLEERAKVRDVAGDNQTVLAAQVVALQGELSKQKDAGAVTAQLEAQRRDVAELAQQLAETRQAMRELQEKAAPSKVYEFEPEPTAPPFEFSDDPAVEAATSEVGVALTGLHEDLWRLAGAPGNAEFAAELARGFHGFADRALAGGLEAVHKLAATCEDMVLWMVKMPRKVPGMIAPLEEALELLRDLTRLPDPALVADPVNASVYAVDDDVDNCECIAMSLEKLGLSARYAVRPEVALKDLEVQAVDLIILDVSLPGMDGFELLTHIRHLPFHARTPIIFVTGLMSARERIDEMPNDLHAFVAKPYNLNELGLKGLEMILRARIGALEVAPVE